MKVNMIKTLMMAGLMIFLAQSKAMASPTQVVFTVPVRVTPTTLRASTQVSCKIQRGGRRVLSTRGTLVSTGGTVLGTGASSPVRNQRIVNVTVRAKRTMTFRKGDHWSCVLYYRGKFIYLTDVADPRRTTPTVSGTF